MAYVLAYTYDPKKKKKCNRRNYGNKKKSLMNCKIGDVISIKQKMYILISINNKGNFDALPIIMSCTDKGVVHIARGYYAGYKTCPFKLDKAGQCRVEFQAGGLQSVNEIIKLNAEFVQQKKQEAQSVNRPKRKNVSISYPYNGLVRITKVYRGGTVSPK